MEKTTMLPLPLDEVLMDGIDEMVFVVRVGGNESFFYEFINKAVLEKTDMDESVIGKSLQEVHPQKIWYKLYSEFNKILSKDKNVSYEDIYETSSHEHIYTETKSSPVFNGKGECTHIISIIKDKTKRTLTEMEINEIPENFKNREDQHRSLFEYNGDAIFTITLTGQILDANPATMKLSGYTLEELKGTSFFSHIEYEGSKRTRKFLKQANEEDLKDFRINLMDKTGSPIGCFVKFTPIKTQNEIVGFYIILKDMRELDKMIGQYVESEQQFHIIAENAHDVIALIGRKKEYLYISPSCENVYGFHSSDYIGKSPFYNVHPEDIHIVEDNLVQAVQEGTHCKLRLRLKHKARGWIWSEINGNPVYDEHNIFKHMVLIVRDISLQKEHELKLEFFAYHDSLTELPNRRFFMECLAEEIKVLEITAEGFAIVILDINEFKQINDLHGHEIGDSVIREFAKRLNCVKGEGNIAARLGGDEFILLIKNVLTESRAVQAVEEILCAMEEPWHIEGLILDVTTSIGMALAPLEEADISNLLKKADMAMYKAKEVGRNAYKISQQ